MPALLEKLPIVRGKYILHADLKSQVWFRVGGPAEILFKPADEKDLEHFLQHLPKDIPWQVIGVGSNLLIRDGGLPGVVIKLGKGFNHITFVDGTVTAGAAALDRTVALEAAQQGIGGLEFLVGIPGTIGGAIKMNAGAYGGEVKDRLISCKVLDAAGKIHVLNPQDLELTYRHSNLPDTSVVLEATFQGIKDAPSAILEKLETIMKTREETQPIRAKTGGSTFKNPPHQKAWQLIDQAGCRGLTLGGAQVSEKHCNFLINTGTATAKDLEELGDTVQQKVLEKFGIMLEWEIKRLGERNKK